MYKEQSYTSLHVHTEYSNIRLLDAINKLEPTIQYAFDLGLNGMAITDHESLSGHIKALQFINKKKKEDEQWKDFKLILGNEIYLCRNGLNESNYEKGERFPHFILLAKDAEGHRQLRELSSKAWGHSFNAFMTRVPTYYADIEEVIGRNPGHVIASTACYGGWLGISHEAKEYEQGENFIQWCKNIFKEDFYLELQPARYDAQIQYNQWLLQMSGKHQVKCIVTTDAHYLKQSDREIHAAFLNSKDGDRETSEFYAYTYLMSPQEIVSLMEDYLSVETIQWLFDNTNEIYTKIEEYDLAKPQIVPKIVDDRSTVNWQGWLQRITIQEKYEYLNKYLNSPYEDDRYFLYLGLYNLEKMKLQKEKRQRYIDRLEEEAVELWKVSEGIKQPLSAYLLTVRNIVSIIWDEAQSIVGPSRGSAGCLLFNYLIGVTDMNPLEQGVECPVWRFIHREKIELSDIDTDSEGCRRNHILQILDEHMIHQGGRSLNVATFGTLGTRSAILTAARGLGIDVDVAQYLTTMIPQERGFLWPLKDCIEGNREKDRRPIRELKVEFNKYPGFLEMTKAIEGLICQVGTHASGVCLYNTDIWDYSCSMRAPSGLEQTQWDLHDAEYAGSLKFDLLSVEGCDRIHKCMDLLLADGLIEWQGSLRKTYVKYLHPDILKRDGEDLWQKTWDGSIIDLFKLEGATGKQALSVIKPSSLPELAAINSLMRLMPEKGAKTPSEEYAYYKQHPEILKQEIYALDGTEKEKEILYNFLKKYNGVCESQENIMLLSMIPEFTNFGYKDANGLRKLIAKKKMKEIPMFRKKFMEAGAAQGCSQGILNYLWDVQVHRQLGYSFSQIHTTAYSLIALQEMNLNYYYPPIYWATACLTINSGGADEDLKGTTDYGRLSAAIGRIKKQGIIVELPNVNKSSFGFTPDADNNSIVYGLKGIADVGDDLINRIIENRPYNSFNHFMEKIQPGKTETIALIKAGCFDKLEKEINREQLMSDYLHTLIPPKPRLTMANANALIKYDILPESQSYYVHLFNFNKYLKLKKKEDSYILDERAYHYFTKHFDVDNLEVKGKTTSINAKLWSKLYDTKMADLKKFISDNEQELINKLQDAEVQVIMEQYCKGTISTWEMDTVGFYSHEHELLNATHNQFNFVNFFDLPFTPKPIEQKEYKGRMIPKYAFETICGTVLDKNSNKHIIVLSTPYGVVNVKATADHYSKYDKQISLFNKETNKKEIVERSWFKRGNKIIVNGYRSGDQFMARGRQSENIYPFHKVLEIDKDKQLTSTKYRADD